jgi:hypothetical protein
MTEYTGQRIITLLEALSIKEGISNNLLQVISGGPIIPTLQLSLLRVDEVVSGTTFPITTTTFVGSSIIGAVESQAEWSIKRIVEVKSSALNTQTTITYPNGILSNSFSWTMRASYTYL